jgi:hypothetical protein
MEDYELMVKSYIERDKGAVKLKNDLMRSKEMPGMSKFIGDSGGDITPQEEHLKRNLVTPNYTEYMSNKTNGGPVEVSVGL